MDSLDVESNISQSSGSSMSKKLKQDEDSSASDLGNSNSVAESDMSYHDDEDDCGSDDPSEYGDDDFLYDDDDDDDYLKLQSQFENIPPGVEAPLPWLKDPAPSKGLPAAMSTSSLPSLPAKIDSVDHPSSSSTVSEEENREDEVLGKYENFKSFDIIDDFSDHHYSDAELSREQKPDKNWGKKIQEEWKILEKNLPDTIFVRVCEVRMDLLRAVIVGPAGTPYHDGLFTFDAIFPPAYPSVPPMVFYYSGGLRLNPNLYECGKVCLSLLGTWSGKEQTEMWVPGKSTMLQVLVSIQALILNAEPFFNEPGYERTYKGADGEKRSKRYNEEVFVLSLKTMVYTLRRPPRHFEDLVVGHFRNRAHDILLACKAYSTGALVGSFSKDAVQNVNENRVKDGFRAALFSMMNTLIRNFTNNGSKDCEQFRPTA